MVVKVSGELSIYFCLRVIRVNEVVRGWGRVWFCFNNVFKYISVYGVYWRVEFLYLYGSNEIEGNEVKESY